MAKGGKTTQEIKLPPEIEAAAKSNIDLARQVGNLPYAPYFGGSVAAFTPAQMSGFNQMNQASNAFGMEGKAGMGLPKPQDFGGISAYSTEKPYNAAMAQVDPKVLELYKQFFYPNAPFAPAAAQPQQQPAAANNATGNPLSDPSHPQYYAFGGGSRGDRR